MASRRSSREHKNKFNVGDCVETSKGEKCIIRFIGRVDGFSSGTVYGIEYIDGTIGEHNGKYKGKKYFIGLPKRCAFIKYNPIRRKAKFYDINHSKKSHRTKRTKCSASTPRAKRVMTSHSCTPRPKRVTATYSSTPRARKSK